MKYFICSFNSLDQNYYLFFLNDFYSLNFIPAFSALTLTNFSFLNTSSLHFCTELQWNILSFNICFFKTRFRAIYFD